MLVAELARSPATLVSAPTNAPYRVVHETTAYSDGQEVTVPQHVAEQWLRSRWVEPVTSKEK
jgi:hypothetical protein